ncbi:MAG: cytochrome c biogenesis protein CcdA [Deltaproteobacteria bacterium]|nr:MAG: cytochrome c biogenesis protein CcdA [Deltaproteobacteria bacterium]
MTEGLSITSSITVFTAWVAGIFSFFSPCVLPLVPAYLSLITGISVKEMNEGEKGTVDILIKTLFFIFGFSLIFILLGASATFIGKFLLVKGTIFKKIAGIIIVIFGLHMMGLFRIGFLYREKRIHSEVKSFGILGSFLMGAAFAFGWSPCVGPILGGILALAGTQNSIGKGIMLLSFYSFGLAIPFILLGISFGRFMRVFGKIKPHLRKVEIISGLLLIIVGILIFTDSFSKLSILFVKWFSA